MGLFGTNLMRENAKKRQEELNEELTKKDTKLNKKYIMYPIILLIVSILLFSVSVMFYY